MPRRGLRGRGFSIDNLLLGGGTSNVTIDTPSCVNGVVGYTNLYTSPQDIIVKNLTINSQLLPTVYTSGSPAYYLYRIMANGTITINTSGGIRCGGDIPAGGSGWTSSQGCVGYLGSFQYGSGIFYNTLGGSGNGGSANMSGTGTAGQPNGAKPNSPLTYFGGSGGYGKVYSSGTVAAGGFSFIDSLTVPGPAVINEFSSSIYTEGLIYCNIDGNSGSYPANGYFLRPHVINGGGGGGGSTNAPADIGGGAAGGGVCHLTCDTLILGGSSGNIQADGGSGSGGGGGGGVVIIVASEIVWGDSAIITVRGGTGVDGGATNGKPGRVMIFSNNLVYSWDTRRIPSFDGIVTKAMYDAAVLAYNL